MRKKEVVTTAHSDDYTIIRSGTRIVGNVTSDKIIVSGTIDGDCVIREEMIVNNGGRINGNITKVNDNETNIIIYGDVHGDIHAARVEIASSGIVTGCIVTDKIVIDEGGVFNGTCSMNGSDDIEIENLE